MMSRWGSECFSCARSQKNIFPEINFFVLSAKLRANYIHFKFCIGRLISIIQIAEIWIFRIYENGDVDPEAWIFQEDLEI